MAPSPAADDWYSEALYYDVLFSYDPTREIEFLLGACERYGDGPPQLAVEAFCGTGRLMRAWPGRIVGFDLSRAMVGFCRRQGLHAFQADAARFALAPDCCDLVFSLIDSFRHLLERQQAQAHFEAAAEALRPGGLYVLGLDVSGGLEPQGSREAWSAERGDVRVKGLIEVEASPPGANTEVMRVELDVRHGKLRRRLVSRQPLSIYTPLTLERLWRDHGSFTLAACFDRRYDLARPRELAGIDGSAVVVLRRR